MEQQPQNVYNNCNIFEAGSINVHAGGIVNIGQPLSSSAPSEEGGLEGATGGQVIPPALRTPAAQELLRKAQAAGLLDERFQPIGNKTKAAIIADEIATKLGLEPRWKPFEELWGVTNLRQCCYNAGGTERGGTARIEIRNLLK